MTRLRLMRTALSDAMEPRTSACNYAILRRSHFHLVRSYYSKDEHAVKVGLTKDSYCFQHHPSRCCCAQPDSSTSEQAVLAILAI